MYNKAGTAAAFQLASERRSCYELFASHEGLQHHLQDFPRHRVPFKRKAYDILNYWAEHGGRRKCWTCAKSYASLTFLAEHLDKYGPRQTGMIPGRKQDNGWTNRRDAEERQWLTGV